jgi:hypothetical protein
VFDPHHFVGHKICILHGSPYTAIVIFACTQ